MISVLMAFIRSNHIKPSIQKIRLIVTYAHFQVSWSWLFFRQKTHFENDLI